MGRRKKAEAAPAVAVDEGFDASNPYHIPEFSKDDARPCLIEESKFATLFPKYLENYLQTVWKEVVQVLKHYDLEGKLDLIEGSITVTTTRKTWDPYAIIKSRDFIKLLSRSVPLHQAQKIFQDDMTYDIVKIASYCRNKERFVKRRQRLIGPNAQTLKALELLTDCYVLVQGATVAIMGSWKGCKAARQVVIDCMRNVHPIYGIKQLLIKRELAKDPAMKNEDWGRFIPQFRKTHQKKRKKVVDPAHPKRGVWKEKGPYSAFPPDQKPRKEDLQMASGEYWRIKDAEDKQRLKEKKLKRKRDDDEQAGRVDAAPPPAKQKRKEKKGKKKGGAAE
eukprot:Hpha_TRINITY_DN199_c0_g1::TRINITY_DN199_c0_g1_i1::g.82212::m.82212/K06961/KRR1; ribosomal RNA assembly protein